MKTTGLFFGLFIAVVACSAGISLAQEQSRITLGGNISDNQNTNPFPPQSRSLNPGEVDHLIRAEWKQNGIVPAPMVDDARFLRRIYLDIVGTIPPPEAVTTFLADRSPDKRARAVQFLLASPRYADHWTDYWNTTLMGRSVRSQVVDPSRFRDWLHTQFASNVPWNKLVYSLLTASGQNSDGRIYAQAYGPGKAVDQKENAGVMPTPMPARARIRRANGPFVRQEPLQQPIVPAITTPQTASETMMAPDNDMAPNVAPVNGATNWLLKYQGNPQDLSGNASKIFLGVQIQCAQCHDHKTEKWKQDDFRKFTACFVATRPRPVDVGMVKGRIRRVDLEDFPRVFVPRKTRPGKTNSIAEYASFPPTALDGSDFSSNPNRREALAAWMTADSNPWFAQAFVNRMWGHFLGRGFIEPIDDIRPSNPVAAPAALRALTNDFVVHRYDIKHLIATICATQVYQLAAAPAEKSDQDNKYWAHYRLKQMGPEELMDSLVSATNIGPVLERVAGDKLDALKFAMQKQFTFLFDVDEEFEQKEFEGTIPQALMLLNGNLVNRGATPIPGTALAETLASSSEDASRIESLYLRTLSRRPNPTEVRNWMSFLHTPRTVVTNPDAPTTTMTQRQQNRALLQAMRKNAIKRNNGIDPLARIAGRVNYAVQTPEQQAYEDMFWALLNSSEFIFNH